jgi:hypothetical protein
MIVLSTKVSRPNPVSIALGFVLGFGVKVMQSQAQVFTESLTWVTLLTFNAKRTSGTTTAAEIPTAKKFLHKRILAWKKMDVSTYKCTGKRNQAPSQYPS